MQLDVVDLPVSSVGHVEDDPCSCSVLQIVKLETPISRARILGKMDYFYFLRHMYETCL
jgi:hypothetical protein